METEFKTADAASYNEHVESFDRFTARMSTPMAARMVDLAGIGPTSRVLDIGTGTGIVAIEALATGATLTGIDLSEKMMELARRRVAERGLGAKADFRAMDAEALELQDRSFDSVVSLYALLHFPSPEKALAEMLRVLKPGGTMVLAVGSGPRWLSPAGARHAVELLPHLIARRRGREWVAPAALDDLLEKHLVKDSSLQEESELAGRGRNRSASIRPLVAAAGFTDISTDWTGLMTEFTTAEEFWEVQRTFSSIARKRINAAPPERVKALKAGFLSECQRLLDQGGRLVYPTGAFFVRARRPRD